MERYDQDYMMHYGVLGMKWGVRKARANSVKANNARRKGDTQTADKYENKSKRIMDKHVSRSSKGTVERVERTSTGKLVAQSLVMGTYGALKYNTLRSQDVSIGRAFVNSYGHNVVNYATSGLASIIEPRLHAKGKTPESATYINDRVSDAQRIAKNISRQYNY